nr:uncharacterized protein LOC113804624 [Penaeus vannamei]
MNVVLDSVLGRHTLAYLDDVVVASASFSEHLHLQETLALLHDAGMKLNLEKCELAKHQVKFLGFIVGPEGVRPYPTKTTAIAEMKRSRSVQDVRLSWGFVAMAKPLTALTKKGVKFEWGDAAQLVFTTLKDTLVRNPVLCLPNFSQPFEVHCDASTQALGGALLQHDAEGVPHAIAYWSRTLKDAETRYAVIDLEALAVLVAVRELAVLEAVRAFDPYIYGRRFEVWTVHQPLIEVFSGRTKSTRLSDGSPPAQKACPLEQAQEPHEDATDPLDLTRMTAVQVREHQLQDPVCEDMLGWLEGRQTVPGERPAALSSFEVEGVLYYLRTFPDQNLQGAWYFPNMHRLAREYVARCHACQQRKGVAGRAPMEGHPLPEAPLVRVSADLMDLWGSATGFQYILSIVDYHTRFIQLVPLHDKSANRVLQAFVDHYMTLFGPPGHLYTDNVLEFSSDEWHSLLEALQCASAIHRAVGDQPLYLLTGCMALFGKGLTNRQTADQDLSLARLADACRLAVEAARNSGPYEEGTLVLRKIQRNHGPLGDRWLGPCRVQKQLGPVSYNVLDLRPPHRAVTVHANQMRPYTPAAEVDFLEENDRVLCV